MRVQIPLCFASEEGTSDLRGRAKKRNPRHFVVTGVVIFQKCAAVCRTMLSDAYH